MAGDLPASLGVVGAGTMGAGIAQLGCLAGIQTVLHDPVADALERGAQSVHAGLEKGSNPSSDRRPRWSPEEARAAAQRLRTAGELEGLAGCELVIEAAPESAELKRELFARLSAVCGEQAILATNTSSIPVTALGSAAARAESVVGMHFFNPPPLMRLLEVVRGDGTGERALAVARATGEAMGKRVIVASDGPGFLVNRCARPFGGEALRLLSERVATVQQIDRICRLGGGFRMGPFELMDLVGIDVGLEVARSFHSQSFGEPRWRPSPLQERMVAAGRVGRKSGRGWYRYGQDGPRGDDPQPPPTGGGDARVVAVEGRSSLASELRAMAGAAGWDAREPEELRGAAPELVVDASGPATVSDPEVAALGTGMGAAPLVTACTHRSLATSGEPDACGFSLVPPLYEARLVELTRLSSTATEAVQAAEGFFASLGLVTEWVDDAPGLVLARIICQLVNEAAFAIGEGVGSADDVDAGATLGLNHPRGPVAWGEAIGLDAVLATVDGLWEELREERYRAAPLLRRAASTGSGLR